MSWTLLLVLGCCTGATVAFGGPPVAHDVDLDTETKTLVDFPLPGREILAVPSAVLEDNPWKMYYRARPAGVAVERIREAVTLDDLDRLDGEPQPPLQFSLPVDFRADGPLTLEAIPVESLTPTKGLTSWLPERVQGWLSHLPSPSSLIPHLPSYIPGVEFEAEVHRKPTPLPHIPTPTELLQRVNTAVDGALSRLHLKQQQLVELIQCTCPRPARCEGLFQEFLSVNGPPSSSAPDAPAQRPVTGGEPGVSLFAGLTTPEGGHGPEFGFYVDQSGPHVGHYQHGANPSPTAPTASPEPSTATSSPSSLSSASLISS